MSGQEVGPVVRPNAPIPGGPPEPAGNKSARSSPHTPAGEARPDGFGWTRETLGS